MTVLQRNTATGVDFKPSARKVAIAALIAALAVGAALTLASSGGSETAAGSQSAQSLGVQDQSVALIERVHAESLASQGDFGSFGTIPVYADPAWSPASADTPANLADRIDGYPVAPTEESPSGETTQFSHGEWTAK